MRHLDCSADHPFPLGAATQLLYWAARNWDELQEEAGAGPLELMSAHRAYPYIYRRCVRGLDEETRLEIDALLGDTAAKAEVQRLRRSAIDLLDAEFA